MPATAGTTTIEVPIPIRERLANLRAHPRQPYHEVVQRALDALEMRTGKRELDALVAKHRNELRKAARRNGIEKLWLFGSRARGESGPDSGVDLLYRAPPTVDIWSVSGFILDAQDIVGCKVDLLDIDGLSERLRHVVDGAVPL
jgi:uncharacterized protein